MNLSKVLKDSNEFIAENLLAGHKAEGPVWGNFAKPLEKIENAAIDKRPLLKSTVPEPPQVKDDLEDNDFSRPAEKQDVVETEPADSAEQHIAEEPPAPPVEIDIEAIARESYEKGIKAGIDRMERDYGSSIRALHAACEQMNVLRDTILENSMKEMKDLVLIIAEKILRQSLASQKETILQTVEDAMRMAVKSDEFIIQLNPADLEIVRERSQDFINTFSGLENIILQSDPTIEQGGCIIESSNCTVDATVASQLEILADALKKS